MRLKHQKCNIAFLQETVLKHDIERSIRSEWSGGCFFDHGTKHSKGVAILIRSGLPIDIINVHCKGDGRAIIIEISCNYKTYFCVNVT